MDDLGSMISDRGLSIRDLGSGISDQGSGIWDPRIEGSRQCASPRYRIRVMRTTIVAVAFSLAVTGGAFAQGRGGGGAAGPIQTIEARTTGFQKLDGFMPLYWDEKT